jgi:hypothetical protein
MTRLILLTFFLIQIAVVVKSQTKTPPKPDTTKRTSDKSAIAIDTLDYKTQAILEAGKFKSIDSADIKIKKSGPILQFGKIDTADLKLTTCDFEKDANAMVLFDKGDMVCGAAGLALVRHKRIKILNELGKGEANIRIEFNNKFGEEHIVAVEAETINLENGKLIYTKLDPKLIYAIHTDKQKDAIVFSLPNVKTGSVVEYRYEWVRNFSRNFPEWDFQNDLPTRYSQINILMSPQFTFSALYRKNQPFIKDTVSSLGYGHIWAMEKIPAKKEEAFMRSAVDGLESLTLALSSVDVYGTKTTIAESWQGVGKQIVDDKLFSKPFDQSPNDEGLIRQAKALKSDDERIAFLFNQVKTKMKWNDQENWFSKDGIKSAWKKKSGNWGEINMTLCYFLKEAGIKAYPMLVSTRENGKLLPNFVNVYQINKLVTYIPVDSTRNYVLDATDKYHSYNEPPFDLLDSYGLCLDKEKNKYDLVFIKKTAPVKQIFFVNASISSNGTMTGEAELNSFSYSKSASVELYNKLDEKKYIEVLKDNDNNLNITSLKLENAEIDSLPLTQTLQFKLNLPGTDDKYIYFSPNLFISGRNNPFVNDTRFADIDFGYLKILNLNGRYKIPDGYKIESIPKSVNLLTEDKSIGFKRVIVEEEGYVVVHYVINHKTTTYSRDHYKLIHDYYKKMYEMLSEQIVLKKS